MTAQISPTFAADSDPRETEEWLAALGSVIAREGAERAEFLLRRQSEFSRQRGIGTATSRNSAYLNTIAVEHEQQFPGDAALERRLEAVMRWNALATVLRANRDHSGLGGHLASYASAATLYEVGFNHFFRATASEGSAHDGDLVLYQGHVSPGIYARALLQGQLTTKLLDRFRREVDSPGLSSYPHPWLMPEFWQFPTVSMGLGALSAIYQARFMKYLENRGLAKTEARKVWCFLGDGEMDEPESMGALGVAGREKLDNLVFVINCNLQRLDGPVRGNGKIIQELERAFLGAGWNVIKVIWGGSWDALLARDRSGALKRRMEAYLDGEYQTLGTRDAAYLREHFLGKDPELAALVSNMSDEQLLSLEYGGHDPQKVYAAYAAAVAHRGQPTVILAKTVKGYGLGSRAAGRNVAHQGKDMTADDLRAFRARFALPLDDSQLASLEYWVPSPQSPELEYLKARREQLGGPLPARKRALPPLAVPALSSFAPVMEASLPGRASSTTRAFVRVLEILLQDAQLGPRVVPIVADEARTFGMEGLFRKYGIWSQEGQLYPPEDERSPNFYKESASGQLLQEGISEAGAMSSWLAAATSYSAHGLQMIPFFIYYSMFGVQRTGDLWWAAGDSRARGFLLGGTSGRTTLNGEGLQHEDGHSHVWAAAIPNCVPYDPCFAYEVAVIIHDGLRRMLHDQEDVYFYITLLNENYEQPALPGGIEADLLRGMYRLRSSGSPAAAHVQLLGAGAILREVIAAAELLAADWGVTADIWSCPSFTLLARDGQSSERWNLLHPDVSEPRLSHVERCLRDTRGPVIAATDYVRALPEQIRPWVRGRYTVLGTDGFGRSDTRERLRHFFEVDRHWIVLAALKALADEQILPAATVLAALHRYGLDPNKADPRTV
ncbi:MAG TPA: pyruvate dehydrogenase (acetyl-transferring), homodimeric type [Polyangiaceae bacterium]|nr:pyruvate dehydrogenase (acetyl-transferring), homodimeric type [Polyangiaceae bacterium]